MAHNTNLMMLLYFTIIDIKHINIAISNNVTFILTLIIIKNKHARTACFARISSP